MKTQKVILTIKNYGTMTLEVYPDKAPASVEAFLSYVKSGFYDGLTFHRCIPDFMIQGGDPTGTGRGDPSLKRIPGEFSHNGFPNDLKFERGVLGMARSQDPNSATSQFFICQCKCDWLDGEYAAFGKVTEGLEVIDKVATCRKKPSFFGTPSEPAEPVVIEKMCLA